MGGDSGQLCHRNCPSQALPLEIEVHQVLVSEDQRLGVLVLQVVQHSVPSVPPLVQVDKAVLPSAEVPNLPYSKINMNQLLHDEQNATTICQPS